MRRIAFIATVALGLSGSLPSLASNDPYQSLQWGIAKIGAPTAWNASEGEGIVVAIVDTGVHLTHEDLNVPGKLVAGYDFQDNDSDPQDQNGHGTHVAGIAAAATGNDKGIAGTAGAARIMPIRILNAVGADLTLLESKTRAGVKWAVDHGAKVINMSFGSATGGGPGSDMKWAINYAWSHGAVCVIAAGNDDGASSGYTTEPALIVVATDKNDKRASYSNIAGSARWGVSAPGSSVYSTWYNFPTGGNKSYATKDGTSMAAPHVSGAVALLMSLGLSPEEAVNRLLDTAVDLGAPGKDSTYGAGRIDLASATAGLGTSGGGGGSSTGGSTGGGGASSGSGPGGSSSSTSVSGSPRSSTGKTGSSGSEVAGSPASASQEGSGDHTLTRDNPSNSLQSEEGEPGLFKNAEGKPIPLIWVAVALLLAASALFVFKHRRKSTNKNML